MGNKRNNYYASSGDLSNYVAESNLDATYESKGNRISALVVSSGNGHLLLEHSDVTRESVIAESRRIYEDFIKEKLEIPLRKWQEKEEFEKTSAWEQRVNTSSLKHLEDSLLAIANEEFITSYSPHVNPELKQYDAVNEVFLSVDKTFGEIPIKVPRECAKSFKQSWENVKIIPQWSVTPNGRFILEEADFQVSPTEQYRYDRGESITYNEAITE